jgi:hypothetical protein
MDATLMEARCGLLPLFEGRGNGNGMTHNGFGLCVVALSKNLKLTTTLDRAITQNPCYVPLNLEAKCSK